MNKKWIGVIILAVVGAALAFVAIEYLTEPISKVPSYLGGHHVRGHFKRRGYAVAALAVIAFGVAGYLVYTIMKKPALTTSAPSRSEAGPATQEAGSSTESLLAGNATSPSTPSTTEQPSSPPTPDNSNAG
jgi:hypothetical protein